MLQGSTTTRIIKTQKQSSNWFRSLKILFNGNGEIMLEIILIDQFSLNTLDNLRQLGEDNQQLYESLTIINIGYNLYKVSNPIKLIFSPFLVSTRIITEKIIVIQQIQESTKLSSSFNRNVYYLSKIYNYCVYEGQVGQIDKLNQPENYESYKIKNELPKKQQDLIKRNTKQRRQVIQLYEYKWINLRKMVYMVIFNQTGLFWQISF